MYLCKKNINNMVRKKILMIIFCVFSFLTINAETLFFDSLYTLKNKNIIIDEYIAIDNNRYCIGDTITIGVPHNDGYYYYIVNNDNPMINFPIMYVGKKIIIENFCLTGNKKNGFEVLIICKLENKIELTIPIDRALISNEIKR